jgi:hypothetical protein
MAATESAEFADWLRKELKTRGWGVRTLARTINPANPEIPRRAINHYMRGSRPTEPYAVAIADAFGLDRSQVPVEEVARPGDPFHGPNSAAPPGDRGDRHAGARAKKGLAA